MPVQSGLLVLGASSRVGRLLYNLWRQGALHFSDRPIWQFRPSTAERHYPLLPESNVIWDMLHDPMPPLSPTGVICLAGPTSGPDLTDNAALAQVAIDAAQGAPLIYVSSQAVYGAEPGPLTENSPCRPKAYGAAKLAAEAVLIEHSNATCVRVGNVVGADMLMMAAERGPITLDRFADGRSPRRMMIGVHTLGKAFTDLLALGEITRPVLNLAQPGLVAMSDLVTASGHVWSWRSAPDHALAELSLDLTHILSLIHLPPAAPENLIAEAKQAGWPL